jgi:hypothetical protein
MPTDRGLVVVRDESDGTKSVFVCARVVDGTPRHTYATHVRARQVVIEPTVRMRRNGHSAFTTEIAEVTGTEEGVVYVSFPDYA